MRMKKMVATTPKQKRAAATSIKYNTNPNATYRAELKSAKAGSKAGARAKSMRLTSTATPGQSRTLNERGRTALRLEKAATRQAAPKKTAATLKKTYKTKLPR